MGLLSLVVQIALSLGLHRDPDRSPGKYTFFEAEERRRLFWNLFMLCILSSASLSRTWAVFDLNGVRVGSSLSRDLQLSRISSRSIPSCHSTATTVRRASHSLSPSELTSSFRRRRNPRRSDRDGWR